MSYNGRMRSRDRCLAMGAWLALATAGPAVAAPGGPQVLEAGEGFPPDAVAADVDGSTWLALLVHGGR